MGHVFLATDLNLSRQVALKVVSDSMVSGTDPQSDADFRRRFHHEAEALAQLDCDHVIRIYEHGEFEGTPFIATQYVAGGELGTLLRQRGSMPLDRAALVCAQIAEALAEAHDVGIVHRDVKTSNVLIRNPDAARLHAVLCDFGIAHTGDGGFTATGAVAGTWAYLAPERAKGARCDTRQRPLLTGLSLLGLPHRQRALHRIRRGSRDRSRERGGSPTGRRRCRHRAAQPGARSAARQGARRPVPERPRRTGRPPRTRAGRSPRWSTRASQERVRKPADAVG